MLAMALAAAPLTAANTTATGTMTIDGKAYNISGPAECLYTPHGSIYETPSVMWGVRMDARGASSGVSRLNATIWQPTAGGAAQILFQALTPAGPVEVATVVKGTVKGSAVARGDRKGAGGTLVIDGRTATGKSVSMTVNCGGFVPPEDNG
jgi:hypothetical protein